jgi:hypothetical protein
LTIVPTTQKLEGQTVARLPSVPGIGKILYVVRRDELQAITRFPRGQACVAYCRLGTCAKAAVRKRDGTAGTKSGQASRTWACSEAAV